MARCGWCITGDHAHCAVVIEMGTKPGKRAFKTGTGHHPHLWHCACKRCEGKTKCVDCQRRGRSTTSGRCTDTANCTAWLTTHEPAIPPKIKERANART